jgi:hypothetical protein
MGPRHVVSDKENKRELMYWNFVVIDSVIKNQLNTEILVLSVVTDPLSQSLEIDAG